LPGEGLDYARFQARFGVDPAARWRLELDALLESGLISRDSARARILEPGLLVSSEIASRFL
jgi:coproporphyrinogen III oxidase-like Fe-S oxidoreductase